MTFQLVLPAPDGKNITIEKAAIKELETYQQNIIRFIFNCYVNGKAGAVLNVDHEMNYIHACALSLKAIDNNQNGNSPMIIMCNEGQYLSWLYFMKKYSGLEVYKVTKNNIEKLLNRNSALVLIVTEKEHKNLRNFVKDYNFLCLIVDEVDYFIEKLLIKQIKADFNFGITSNNFVKNRNQPLQWKIINWALKKSNNLYKNLSDFIEYDNLYYNGRVDPYTDFWYTIQWSYFSSSDKESMIEKHKTLKQHILDWARTNDYVPAAVEKKRKATTRHKSSKKKSVEPTDQSFDYWSTDEDNPIDLSAFETKSFSASISFDSALNSSNSSLFNSSCTSSSDLNSSKLTLKRPKSFISPNKSVIYERNNNGMVESCGKSVLPHHLRITKSAVDCLFVDETTATQRSSSLNCQPSETKQVGNKKHRSLLDKTTEIFDINQICEEMEDEKLLEEFLNCDIESGVENKPCILKDHLQSLMTEKIELIQTEHDSSIDERVTTKINEDINENKPDNSEENEQEKHDNSEENNKQESFTENEPNISNEIEQHNSQENLEENIFATDEINSPSNSEIDNCESDTSLEFPSLRLSESMHDHNSNDHDFQPYVEYEIISSDDEFELFLCKFLTNKPGISMVSNLGELSNTCISDNDNLSHLESDSRRVKSACDGRSRIDPDLEDCKSGNDEENTSDSGNSKTGKDKESQLKPDSDSENYLKSFFACKSQ